MYKLQSQIWPCSAVLSLIYTETLIFPNPHSIYKKLSSLSSYPLVYLPACISCLKSNFLFTSYQKKKKKASDRTSTLHIQMYLILTTPNFW